VKKLSNFVEGVRFVAGWAAYAVEIGGGWRNFRAPTRDQWVDFGRNMRSILSDLRNER
jgi:hypothetical protein